MIQEGSQKCLWDLSRSSKNYLEQERCRGRKATGVGRRKDLEYVIWLNEPKLQKLGLFIILKISVNISTEKKSEFRITASAGGIHGLLKQR